MAEGIYNFIAIDDRVATAGQPTEAQFRGLAEDGYEVVINLAPDGLDTSLAGEDALLGSLGIEYRHLPIAWSTPSLDQLDAFIALMEAARGRTTLVHCQANYRVTAFYGLYAQIRLGWSEPQADALIERIWSANPSYRMDETWKGFIASARARLAAERA